jgi:hypothetical protein
MNRTSAPTATKKMHVLMHVQTLDSSGLQEHYG